MQAFGGPTWFYTQSGLPNSQGQFSYYARSPTLGSTCPPDDDSFFNPSGNTVYVQCKFSGASFDGLTNECEDGTHTCHADATCTDTIQSFTCECNENFQGDGQTDGTGCTEIVLVDECATNTHNCDADAACTDTQLAFTCTCNEGFIDVSENGDGTNCIAAPDCCLSFTVGIETPGDPGTSLSKCDYDF